VASLAQAEAASKYRIVTTTRLIFIGP
jgi:hypothetical protein